MKENKILLQKIDITIDYDLKGYISVRTKSILIKLFFQFTIQKGKLREDRLKRKCK